MEPMTQPLVSIITPVGPRHAEHVRVAAASVQWQSLAPLCEHVIACDGGAEVAPLPWCEIIPADGGPRQTADAASWYEGRPKITLLQSNGERRGPAHTRNRALNAARGLFVLPLDADDYLLPRAVENLLREYSRGRFGYVYGDAYTQERDGRHIYRSAPDYVQDHMRRYNIHVVTALTPTQHWRAVGGWDERVDAWEDWAGHLRLAIAGVCGHRLPQPILTYRVYEGERMQQFYGGAPEHMEAVWRLYRNKEGQIPMANCCGGDPALAQLAANAALGAPLPEAAPMAGGKVRVEYIGEDRGTQTWEHPWGTPIRLGNNAIDRFKDVTPEQAEWLREMGVPIRVVPIFDGPEPPTPLPILAQADVLTPDAAEMKALRPRRQTQRPEA